jgi:S-disulfanyl-L-cysteine oxidoreductase SoxD
MELHGMQKIIALCVISLSLTSFLSAEPQAQAPPPKTVLDGVYSDAQAARGQVPYVALCGRCHGNALEGVSGPVLAGPAFVERWREDTLDTIYNFMREAMPLGRGNASAPIPDSDYLDILAFMLKGNGYRTGDRELTQDELGHVLLIGKDGSKPVPDGSLIMTVGCLSQTPTGSWILFNATEPGRTRKPNDTTPGEMAGSSAKPAGKLIFRLVDLEAVPDFMPADHKGHKMQAKGFLVRQPNAERINLSSIQMLDAKCGS